MKTARLISLLTILMLIFALCAVPAMAHNPDPVPGDGEPTTTTQPPAPTVKVTNFYMEGSNGKMYLCSPTLADNVDKYTFTIPNWMEETNVVIKATSGLKADCSVSTFKESSGVYEAELKEIVKAEQTYSFTLTDPATNAQRTLYITLYRSKLTCKIESVTLKKSDSTISSAGSIEEGLTYTLDSGSTSGYSFTIMPRHENTVTMIRKTGLAENEPITDDRKTKLELNSTRRYTFKPELVEGTNVYTLEVEAGDVKKSCDITIIVGDPNANAPTTTTESTLPTEPSQIVTEPSALPTTAPQYSGGDGFEMKPILWIFVGVIIAVVLGACIFLIANMIGKRHEDDYDDDYYDRPLGRPSRGRDLTDYIDDDYDDGYGSYGGYDGYDDGYGSGYGGRSRSSYRGDYDGGYMGRSGDRYDGGYGDFGTTRGGGARRRNSDYDDYDGYGGGY
ncbi:MAG: hypothetical protein E7559_06740 [Ruminococcaceae bacterium]|nr:hypothetical protein [Oscillospiraceae bacterium]